MLYPLSYEGASAGYRKPRAPPRRRHRPGQRPDGDAEPERDPVSSGERRIAAAHIRDIDHYDIDRLLRACGDSDSLAARASARGALTSGFVHS